MILQIPLNPCPIFRAERSATGRLPFRRGAVPHVCVLNVWLCLITDATHPLLIFNDNSNSIE